jgi:DNA-directed RNA polymerase subunit RPC12/RpoP
MITHLHPNQISFDFSTGTRCGDCRTRLSLLKGKRFPEAWSEITVRTRRGAKTVYLCFDCTQRQSKYDIARAAA